MTGQHDSRITPARGDIAADFLRNEVAAQRYVTGTRRQVATDGLPLRFRPDGKARVETQLLYGETFTVYDEADGWCWGQNEIDGYVGYVPAQALLHDVHRPNHQVSVRTTHLYPGPDIKLPPRRAISMCSRLQVVDVDGSFSRLASGDWVYSKHIVDLDYVMPDLVGTALKFMGTPYLWGGRCGDGLDCSGLVQLVLRMAGIDAPRDSDMQQVQLGSEVAMADPHDFSAVEDGDLVFFPGHVGFFVQGWRFLHANAFDMQVSLHGFSDVLDRADASDAGVTAVRRVGAGAATGADRPQ